jgi:hypothetical protein
METKRAGRNLSTFASSAVLMFALASYSGCGQAAEALPVADLEQGFWVCDYVATTRGVYATPIELCSTIMEQLQTSKFGGDFEALLGWWRENKPAEHQKLEAAQAGN